VDAEEVLKVEPVLDELNAVDARDAIRIVLFVRARSEEGTGQALAAPSSAGSAG
jgi:hypothetical protein